MLKRRIHIRRLLLIAVPAVVIGGGVHVLHGVQARRSETLLLKQADLAEKQGDREKAEEYLRRYLGFQPRDGAALARYGLLLDQRAKSRDDQLQVFLTLEQVLRLDPDRADIRRNVVAAAMGIGRFSDARSHLEKLLGRERPEVQGARGRGTPEEGELEYLFGQCAEGERKYEEAARWYAQAIAHDPTRIDGYVRYAALLQGRLEKPDEADRIMDAREVKGGLIANNGEAPRAFVERGRYRKTFQIEGADRDAARALELAPDEVDALLLAAEVAGDAKDFEAARDYLRRGLEKAPRNGHLCELLARVETKAGRQEEAEKVLNQGIRAVPDGEVEVRARLLVVLGESLIDQHRYAEARELIKDKMGPAKVRPELIRYLDARTLYEEGRWLEASRELEKVRPLLLPGRPDLAFQADLFLGRCYEQLGETDRRYAAYQRAVAFDPLSVPARAGLADTLAALGRADEAIGAYRNLPGQQPAAGIALARLQIARNLRLPEPRRTWAEVDRILDEAATALSESVEVPILRAIVLDAKGQKRAARDLLVRARDRQPKRVELWIALADLEQRRQDRTAAAAVLDEAEKALGDRAELRPARARACISPADKDQARAALVNLKLTDGLEKFTAEDRRRLLQGLSAVHQQIGDLAGAQQLLSGLAPQRPDDLALRLAQFDLALQIGDEAAIRRVLDEIRAVEAKAVGEEGTSWRVAQARYLIWGATRPERGGIDRKALEEARRLLTEAGARRPSWPLVPLGLAEIDDRLGNLDAAIPHYLRAVELGDRRPGVIRRAAELLMARRRYDEAGRLIATAQEGDPDLNGDPPLRRLAAELASQTGDTARALELAREAVAADSKDYHDLLWLGQKFWAAGRPAESEPVLRRAVELAGDAPDAWVAWVQYLVGVNRREQAEAAIEAARARLPEEQAPLALARCYAAVGRPEQARVQYRAALVAQPENVEALKGIAILELTGGRPQDAEPPLRKLVALQARSPGDAAWARGLLAVLLSARGGQAQAKEALKLMGLAEDGSPLQAAPGASDDDLRAKAKILALQKGRPSRLAAIRLLESIAGRGNPTADDRFLLAQLYAAERDWTKYREPMQALLAADPDNPAYLAHYTRSLLTQGDADGASFWLGKLERRQPRAFETVELKARVLTRQGKADDAVVLLKKFTQGKDDHAVRVAALLEELRQDVPAEEMYRKSVSLSRRPEAPLVLAGFLARHNRLSEALDICEQAWQTCPVETAADASMQVLYAASTFEDAPCRRVARWLEDAIRKAPDKIALQFDLAGVRCLQGRYEEAEAINRRIFERDRSVSRPLNNVAWLLAVRGVRGDEALELINCAIALDGPDPGLLDTRGLVYLALGQSDRAIKDLEDAAALQPIPVIYFHLARAYREANKKSDAVRAFQEAETLNLKVADLHLLERGDYQRLRQELARQ